MQKSFFKIFICNVYRIDIITHSLLDMKEFFDESPICKIIVKIVVLTVRYLMITKISFLDEGIAIKVQNNSE